MNNNKPIITNGGCYCGAVRYQVEGELRGVINCHCKQCTKLNGNFGSHSKALKINVTILTSEDLKWFEISETARRGFCQRCGSGIFWDQIKQNALGIIAGTIDHPTHLETIGNIFVKDKSDFYDISDDVHQFDGSSDGELKGDYL